METVSEPQLEHNKSILEYVNREHKRTGRPVLLSRVGTDFGIKFGNFREIYTVSLTDHIRQHLTENLRFPPGLETGPGAAVEPIPTDETGSYVTPEDTPIPLTKNPLDKYPRSLVIAFCLKPTDYTEVYYSVDLPFKYQEIPARDPAPGPGYCLIDKELRIGKRFVDLTPDDYISLSERIAVWIRKNSLEAMVWHRRIRSPTALQRLIEAQPEELRGRLLIPADIAILLSKS